MTKALEKLISRNTEHEIRTEKCLDMCQHKKKFVLTFAKNDQTLIIVEIFTVASYFGSQTFVSICTGQLQKCSDIRLLFHALGIFLPKSLIARSFT